MPPSCYTSQEWYELEVSRMWRRSWFIVGRIEEVPEPGDFQRVDFVGEPLLMVRDRDGEVHVLSAVCRHRGCIIKEGSGRARKLSCPYHGWTYDLSGKLVGVPGMEEAEDFRLEEYGLHALKSEVWGGFVMANMDPDAPALMESLGGLAERFESYRFEDLVVTRKIVTPLKANWKLWLENSREGYHAPIVHADTYRKYFMGRKSNGWRYEGVEGEYEILSGSNDDGLYLPRDGSFELIDGLSDEDRETTHFAIHYPHLLLNVPPSYLAFHQLFPEGPDATTVVTWFCFPRSVVSRDDFDTEASRYYEIVENFIPEDKEVAELTQRGLASGFAKAGRFSVHERPCHVFAKWLLDRVIGESDEEETHC